MTDPIADMLTRVRNAVASRHARVDMPASKLKAEIAKILQDEGYIAGFKLVDDKPTRTGGTARPLIRVLLKYGPGGEKVISGIQRVSRPGRRVYTPADAIGPVLGGLGVSILTTSRGVMTGRSARKAGIGGEVLCNVW
jgi:small subunit ribosomal protein S8